MRIRFDGIYGQNTQGLTVTDNHIRSLFSFFSAFKVTFELNEDTLHFNILPPKFLFRKETWNTIKNISFECIHNELNLKLYSFINLFIGVEG